MLLELAIAANARYIVTYVLLKVSKRDPLEYDKK